MARGGQRPSTSSARTAYRNTTKGGQSRAILADAKQKNADAGSGGALDFSDPNNSAHIL